MANNYRLGIFLKITNLFLFTCISLLLMSVSDDVPVIQTFFLVALTSVLLLLPFIVFTKRLNMASAFSKYYPLRAIFNTAGMVSWLEALSRISANDATAVSYMTPIITSLLAVLFCGERLNYKCALAILTSFIGAYIIIVPDGYSMISEGGMIALFAAVMWACYDIVCKLQTTSQDKFAQTFLTFLYTVIISLPFALSSWQPFDLSDLKIISVVSILSIMNVTVLFLAYKHAPINILMPYSFLRLVMMATATFILFGETIKNRTLVGTTIIIMATLFVFFSMNMRKEAKQV